MAGLLHIPLAVVVAFTGPLALPGCEGSSSREQEVVAEQARPRSLLSAPLFLGDEPPECRTLEILHIAHGEASGRTLDEARALAARLRSELQDAEIPGSQTFRRLSKRYSAAPNAGFGGVLGTFPPGVLSADYERFLWGSETGAVSAPLEREEAVLLLRRGERWAGCRLILVKGDDAAARARAHAARERLEAGEDFGDVAREVSDDAESKARGGDYRVFERGSQDRLLKRASFEAALGEIVGPLETPLGQVVFQRVPTDALAPELWESSWARVRAILVSHAQAPGAIELNSRQFEEARVLAEDLATRLRTEDADMAALAGEYDDDVDGKRRRGDLGWIRRDGLATRDVLEQVFLVPPGTLIGPLPLQVGYLLLLREDA